MGIIGCHIAVDLKRDTSAEEAIFGAYAARTDSQSPPVGADAGGSPLTGLFDAIGDVLFVVF